VLGIAVGGEEQVASQQFDGNAADGPDVRELVPLAALQNDFGRTVLPGADDAAVVLVEESGSSKIDDSDLVAFGKEVAHPFLLLLQHLLLLNQNVLRF
jgi:hypothetical protein